MAARAAQAGLGVVVLERGGSLDAVQWKSIDEGRSSLHRGAFANGPLDIHAMRGLGGLTGNALGGGSRINTAVTIRPREDIFREHWPVDLDWEALAACYDRVESTLHPAPCADTLARLKWMRRLADFLGFPLTRLPLAINWEHLPIEPDSKDEKSSVTQIADWFRGANGVKRSLVQTYLRMARDSGAVVHTNASARLIEPISGGFRVGVDRLDNNNTTSEVITARRVILAAGAINTVQLLFANRDKCQTLPRVSPRLGERFFTNGDRGALLFCDTYDWAADTAPPALAWFDQWDCHRFFMMDLGPAPLARGLIARVLATCAHRPRGSLVQLRHELRGNVTPAAWVIGIMGANERPRRLTHQRNGRLRCHSGSKPVKSSDDSVIPSINALADAAGATWLMVPSWLEQRMPLTVHPLGGAVMSDSPERGVTDSHGEVFGHPGLFIADGSLVPTPTGVPPSMTIAALAERVATRVVESAQ